MHMTPGYVVDRLISVMCPRQAVVAVASGDVLCPDRFPMACVGALLKVIKSNSMPD